ncbi:hypothetical protein B0J13DRAFT_461481 [Dactylonectria estremocensis]|uniref:Kinesin light chain n=1 Tax=Dactylonectria estremocensis TaxID=1079267 RepID=A0A9P9D3X3_9HYPO|nr:hypothetical protein B0J13DRAFT_461481 [Dactylonectria estremocensis]
MAHAVQVGEWAELCGKEIEIAGLLERVSGFLYERGRWREREPVNERALNLWRSVLGEKHPDTISSMASLAETYHGQGRYGEAEPVCIKVLGLRRETLGEKHTDTIRSIADLAAIYHQQGRYSEAEPIKVKVLGLRQETLGEKHLDTIWSMASLATTYHAQGRYDEAEPIYIEVLDLRRTLGEKDVGRLGPFLFFWWGQEASDPLRRMDLLLLEKLGSSLEKFTSLDTL